nr:T9SS type A sorting domain-containing protein [uncultured Dyadobacter sp.]
MKNLCLLVLVLSALHAAFLPAANAQMVLVKSVYVQGLKFYTPFGTHDFSGRYDHNISGVEPFAYGYPVLYRDRYDYINLSYVGKGFCKVLLYLRKIAPGNGSHTWGLFGNIIESSNGQYENGGFLRQLPAGFTAYYPQCASFEGITISGAGCDPYAVAVVPAEYIHLSGEYLQGDTFNSKNTFELIAPSPTLPQQTDVATIQYDGVKWVWVLNQATTPNGKTAADPIILSTNSSVTDLNPPCTGWTNGFELSGNICDGTLPVTLVKFSAERSDSGDAVLEWSTASETNSHHFDIEHSLNAKNWRKIAEVASQGESDTLFDYHYTHTAPSGSVNYYRLKQTDQDSTYTYSRIVSVNFESIPKSSLLYPNPVSDRLYFQNPDLITRIEIVNLSGQTVFQTADGLSEGVSLRNLENGVYVVRTCYEHGGQDARKIMIVK